MRPWSSALLFACLFLLVEPALAVDVRIEAAAQRILKKAVSDDRAKRYALAAARLKKAARACGIDQCLAETKAALLRDLGTMQYQRGNVTAASKSFAEAIALQPDIALNPDLETSNVQAAWDEAKKTATGGKASDSGEPTTKPAGGGATAPTLREPAPEPGPRPEPERDLEPKPTSPSVERTAQNRKEVEPYAHFWIGIAGALDYLVLPSGTDLCKLTPRAVPANSLVAYCTNPDGTDFPTRLSSAQNDALVPGAAGRMQGGLQIGDVRALLAADYAVSRSALVGLRVGYVLNAYTATAAAAEGRAFGRNLHAELRATYVIGHAPLARVGFAPMLFIGAGMSEFDGHATGTVAFTNSVGRQPVNIWITDGPWFAVLGGGLRCQFSLRTAFTAAFRANAAFFGNGLLLTGGPELGFQYGLL
jgi:hypothetical protein